RSAAARRAGPARCRPARPVPRSRPVRRPPGPAGTAPPRRPPSRSRRTGGLVSAACARSAPPWHRPARRPGRRRCPGRHGRLPPAPRARPAPARPPRWCRWPSLSRLGDLGQHPRQLAGLEQLQGDVAAADQLAVDEQLREGRPVRVARQVGPDLRFLQHVDRMEGLGAGLLERLHRAAGEAAHRELRGPLHEQHHRVRLDFGLDALGHLHVASPAMRPAAARGAVTGVGVESMECKPPFTRKESEMAIALPHHSYERSALESHIAGGTLDFRHGNHHKAYDDTRYTMIAGTEFESMPLEEVIRQSEGGMYNSGVPAWVLTLY